MESSLYDRLNGKYSADYLQTAACATAISAGMPFFTPEFLGTPFIPPKFPKCKGTTLKSANLDFYINK